MIRSHSLHFWFLLVPGFLVVSPAVTSPPVLQEEDPSKMEIARKKYHLGQFRNALQYLNALLQEDENHVEALFLRGKIFLALDRMKKARADGRRILNHDEEHWRGHLLLGKIHMHTGNRETARTHLSTVLEQKPDHDESRTLRGLIYWRENRFEEAKTDFSCVEKKNTENPSVLVAMAQTYYITGDPLRARNIMEEDQPGLKGHPGIRRISSFIARGVNPRIEETIQKARKKEREGNLREGITELSEAINTHQKEPYLYVIRGELRRDIGNLKQAEEDARTAIKLEGGEADATYLLGTVCYRRNNFSEAESWFRKCTSHAPAFKQAARQLGRCLIKNNKTREGIDYLETNLTEPVNQPGAAESLVRGYLEEDLLIPCKRLYERRTLPDKLDSLKKKLDRRLANRKTSAGGTLQNNTYRNESLAIRIKLPEGWKQMDKKGSALLEDVLVSPRTGDRLILTKRTTPIGCMNLNPKNKVDQKTLRTLYIDEFIYRAPSFRFVRDQVWQLDDHTGYRALFKKNGNPETLYMNVLSLIRKKQLMTVQYISARKPEQYQEQLNKILNNFVIMKK